MKSNQIKSWINNRKILSNLKVERIPLNSIKNWSFSEKGISHEHNYYFSIVGVNISEEQNKELSWDQPIILQKEIGELGFIIQKITSSFKQKLFLDVPT